MRVVISYDYMKIFVAPSKTFKTTSEEGSKPPVFINETKLLKVKLSLLTKQELVVGLKISTKIANTVYDYFHLSQHQVRAISLFDGTFFKSLDYKTIPSVDNLFILDAYYGLINSNDSIERYRLDFTSSIIGNLYDFWANKIGNYISDSFKDEIIIDLSSQEFSKLLFKSTNLYRIDFVDTNRKLDNVTKKKMRGLFARHLLLNKNVTVEELKDISINHFVYSSSLSTPNYLMFVRS